MVRATTDDLVDAFDLPPEEMHRVENTAGQRGLFQTFSEQVVSQGLVQWRKHSDSVNIIVMSDYCEESGRLLPLKYVHVTATMGERRVAVKCTCNIYKKIRGAALKKLSHFGTDVVLDEDFTCMHCRFYRKYLHEYRDEILSNNTCSNIVSQIQADLGSLNNPFSVLGMVSVRTTTKLSVIAGGDSCAIMNIHFSHSRGCFIKCMNGLCNTNCLNKKKIPKVLPIDSGKVSFCPHMEVVKANLDQFRTELFPQFFGVDTADSDTEETLDAEEDFLDPPPRPRGG